MMKKTGKITRTYKALKIELDLRPDTTFVIGADDAKTLIGRGSTVRIYKVNRTTDVDTIEQAGTAYGTQSGRGIAIRIAAGMPALPTLYASQARVEDVFNGLRGAAVISAPEDLSLSEQKRGPSRQIRRTPKMSFGDVYRGPLRSKEAPSTSSSGMIRV